MLPWQTRWTSRRPSASCWRRGEADSDDPADISPYLAEHVNRFGEDSNHERGIQPEAYGPDLDVGFIPLLHRHDLISAALDRATPEP